MSRAMTRTMLAVLVSIVWLTAATWAEDEPQKADPSLWMRKKLEYSQKILAGLASEDFDALAQNARAMRNLSEIEKHVRARTPGYRTQMQVFLYANDELIRHAEGKNLEGCASAFNQLTLSCVNCHKVIRAPE
jgi:cytochrome c556